ncbi:hypothetical protein [Enterococcus spodopteracolus]|uniref:hypothetical protein n=1 Tax=Enterococcus spodopteracolus TaxID=3034501 RepID=UPI0026473D6B|nr:hypothetical protein [Enterococcus spodopteracolus]
MEDVKELNNVLVDVLLADRFYCVQREIELITAQLEVLDYLLLEHNDIIQQALKTKLEYFRDDLINRRELVLRDRTKKRMVNVQSAWEALRDR